MRSQQSLYPTDFYLSRPYCSDQLHSIISYISLHTRIGLYLPRNKCPFYAPMVRDGPCRNCLTEPKDHKKFYLYSHFVRRIQLLFFRYKFKKIIKNNFNIVKLHHPANIIKYKHKYYRRWSDYTLTQYLKKIDNILY